jgi:protein phosphatase
LLAITVAGDRLLELAALAVVVVVLFRADAPHIPGRAVLPLNDAWAAASASRLAGPPPPTYTRRRRKPRDGKPVALGTAHHYNRSDHRRQVVTDWRPWIDGAGACQCFEGVVEMITYHGQTDVGKRRTLNEDTIFTADGLFVVCDGMGGHKAGEVASQIATDVIAAFVKRSGDDPEITWPYGFETRVSHNGNRLRTAIKLANRAVFRKAASSEDYTGMGTTVVAMLMSPGKPQMTSASVGDSRIYLIRGGAVLQLTRDDSWLNMSYDAGTSLDDLTGASMKDVLIKALGSGDDVDFEVASQELSDGDVVLLCSDGLSNMLPDRRLLEIVSSHGADLQRAGDALVTAANAAGGRDNISVILVRYTA